MELDNISIKFEQDTNFLQLVAQLQTHCQPILIVIEKEGKQTLHYYEKKQQLPKHITFINKHDNIHQFLDTDTNISYYVFGSIAAKLFSSGPETTPKKMKPIITEYISSHIILYDKGKKYKFPYPEKKFIIQYI
jgi:hypothetical protein